MTPDRWRQITDIFHAALERDPESRQDFLRGAYGADLALEREVETLIAAHHKAGSFGDAPVAEPRQALEPGTSLGPYRIGSLLGAGGMGDVYRAHDPRLGRAVAIKVLPAHFLDHPERLARFEREARLLAALNHPHVASLYAVEEFEGGRALVMELVEGEDLADRLMRGPLPLAEALVIARQVAEALEAAHEQGIIHRDLKPANIKVRGDGTAKVLDFGMGKALDSEVANTPGSGGRAAGPSTTSSGSPSAGLLRGTAAYMSPEQAMGKPADRRSDVWAFGVVLWEMLVGRWLYGGETAAETLAQVLAREPDLAALPVGTPPGIRIVIGRCLTKNPRNRLQAIGEARFAIEQVISSPDVPALYPATPPHLPTRPRAWRHWWGPALAMSAAGLTALTFGPWRGSMPLAPLRLSTELGVAATLSVGRDDALAISPDGRVIAFVARPHAEGASQLYVRRLGELKDSRAVALAGTEGAANPFFSPDGRQIAFFAGKQLKRVEVSGGAPVTVCDVAKGRGASWAEDGTIVFVPDSGPGVTLWRVSSGGGQARPLTSLSPGEWGQRWPQVLPGGKAVLYTAPDRPGAVNHANIVVQPFDGGRRKVVVRGAYHARYVTSGHLLFLQRGVLFAMPFDLARLEQTGPAASVVDGVASNIHTASAQFAVAENGTLAYLAGPAIEDGEPVQWLDRVGRMTPLRTTPANWFNIRLAPDGRRLTVDAFAGATADIWVYDMDRDTATPLSRDPASDMKAVWAPDGNSIAFTSNRENSVLNVFWQPSDGTGSPRRLTRSTSAQWPISWHPTGKFLAVEEDNPGTGWDLTIFPMSGDHVAGWSAGAPIAFLASPDAEKEPNFSPDGRWVAYQSNETGRDEVYVRPFRGPGEGWRVSTNGGAFPAWSRTRPELFYGLNGQLMVARYAVQGDAFRAEKPEPLPNARYDDHNPARMFDLHPDGDRFAVAPAPTPNASANQDVVVILNFFEELRRLAPPR